MTKTIITIMFLLISFVGMSQVYPPNIKTDSQKKQYDKQLRRNAIRSTKKIWFTPLGGPSYTPEASLGVGGAVLMSFKTQKNDSISQRSFIPAGVNLSINGTIVVAGAGVLFFNENNFRIFAKYGYRNEPANFFGIGYDQIKGVEKSDSTTGYKRTTLQLNPKFVWQIKPHFFLGPILDINYSKMRDVNSQMASNAAYLKYGNKYKNIGIGGLIQYDTRDDVATPYSGLFASVMGTIYGKYIGGDNNYELLEIEYRQFKQVFNTRNTLAWTAKTQIGYNDVPYTELPSFGSPNDLRGYLLGKYRDKSMAYGIFEFRHMFGSQEAYDSGSFWAKWGAVAWVGSGTIGKTPSDWSTWKLNYGLGLRIQMQPRKNFRLDIGREPGQKWGVYFNMTEAF